MSLPSRAISGLLLFAATVCCSKPVEPTSTAPEANDLTPAFVELQQTALPPGTPPPKQLPALHLSPSERELRVSGWTEELEPRRVRQVIPISQGVPLAMCWRDAAELVVAIHSANGETVLRGWTWDGESLSPTGEDAIFHGPAGTVVSMAADPRSGSLVLLDGKNGRLLEIVGPAATRTLADTISIPGLHGQRSLTITGDPPPSEAATFSLSTIPPDSDTVSPSDVFLKIRDLEPGDGLMDDWVIYES
ncbi:MAG: hypothetical protein ACI9EF_001405 [Pseudohongiellaceae bacterium]